MKSMFDRIMWIGRRTVFLIGLAMILALVLGVASTALGANGKPFILGKATNAATSVTGLIGKVASGSALVVKNPSGGSALGLQVSGGQAPLKVSSEAGTATNLSADLLDGKNSTEFAVTSHDHDGSYYASGSKVANSDLLDGKDSSDFAPAYRRTVVVSPVGSATQNGTALKDALAGIINASATNPYLLKVEPGVYDMGTSPLVMKEWVDIEGSGEGVTTIKRAGNADGRTGTVVGADNSELRFLTAENTGGESYATAIFNWSASPRLTNVTAEASGGTSVNIGIFNYINSSPTMTHVTAKASGGAGTNFGVENYSSSSPTMIDVTVEASGGNSSTGVYNETHSSPTMTSVTARASDGAVNVAVSNGSSSPIIHGSTLEARGGSDSNRALSNSNVGTIRIDNSRLIAAGGVSNTTVYNSGPVTRVGASSLDGGPVENSNNSTVTCAGVYDENYTFFANTCP